MKTATLETHEIYYADYWFDIYAKDYGLTTDKYTSAASYATELTTLALDEGVIKSDLIECFKAVARARFYSERVVFVIPA